MSVIVTQIRIEGNVPDAKLEEAQRYFASLLVRLAGRIFAFGSMRTNQQVFYFASEPGEADEIVDAFNRFGFTILERKVCPELVDASGQALGEEMLHAMFVACFSGGVVDWEAADRPSRVEAAVVDLSDRVEVARRSREWLVGAASDELMLFDLPAKKYH